MNSVFKEYDRNQLSLFPPSMDDWVPANDFSRFLVEAIAKLKLTEFHKGYSLGTGRKAYPPEILLSTLIYAYSNGMRSSRKIEIACQSDLRFRYVSAGLMPDHSTLSRFRSMHEERIVSFFKKTVELAYEMGMKRLGTIAIDGTKISANASLSANKTKDKLEKELKEIVAEASKQDKTEDECFGATKRGDEMPNDIIDPNARASRLESCINRLEEAENKALEKQKQKIKEREDDEQDSGKKKRGRKPKQPEEVVNKDAKANPTDPDSRIMKSQKGYVQGYNAQAAVTEDQLIVSAELTQDENDKKQLTAMVESSESNTKNVKGEEITDILADAGYFNEDEIKKLPDSHPELYIATQKDCNQRKECSSENSPTGRKPSEMTMKQEMERKLLTKKGKQQYSKRGWMVEGTFGQLKHNLKFDRFMRRGLSACKSEWNLICATHNLLKVFRLNNGLVA